MNTPRPHPRDPTKNMWAELFARTDVPPPRKPLIWHAKMFVLASIPPLIAYLWMRSVGEEMDKLKQEKRRWYEREEQILRQKHHEHNQRIAARMSSLEERIKQLESGQPSESPSRLTEEPTGEATSDQSVPAMSSSESIIENPSWTVDPKIFEPRLNFAAQNIARKQELKRLQERNK